MKIRCCKCKKSVTDIDYIQEAAKEYMCSAVDYVIACEPEYNQNTGIFTCRDCIIQEQWETKPKITL